MNKDVREGLKNRKPIFSLVLIILALIGTAFFAVNHYIKNVGATNDFADKYEFKLLVYPEKYALTMSSSPGICISAQCNGPVDKVRYSTTFGSLLTWDIPSGKISDRGKDIELPYETPVYWTPVDGTGLPPTTDKITVKVSILNKHDKLAEKQLDIYYDGSMYFTVQKSPDIKTQETEENLSLPTDTTQAGDPADRQQILLSNLISYKLPDTLMDSDFSKELGSFGGRLFTYKITGKTEPPGSKKSENAAYGWDAYGGLEIYYSLNCAFEAGNLTHISIPWNHSGYIQNLEPLAGCASPAVLAKVSHDLYTAAESANLDSSVKTTSEMWYVFFAKEDSSIQYGIYLNAEIFSKNDIMVLARSVQFKDGAFDNKIQFNGTI